MLIDIDCNSIDVNTVRNNMDINMDSNSMDSNTKYHRNSNQ